MTRKLLASLSILLLTAVTAFAQGLEVKIKTYPNLNDTMIHYHFGLTQPAESFTGPHSGDLAADQESPPVSFYSSQFGEPAVVTVEIRERDGEQIFTGTIVSNMQSPTILRRIKTNPNYDIIAEDLDHFDLSKGYCTLTVRRVEFRLFDKHPTN